MRFGVIVADPPWQFSDKLTMSDVARGAESNYPTLDDQAIVDLDIESISGDDAILALWVPSSLLPLGLQTMAQWGFVQKQVYVWVKTTASGGLAFGMGRLFRQCHELALIGTRGRIYDHLENRSQRSVECAINVGHSVKPDGLHESLELMFPSLAKIELFARSQRPAWMCVGNEITGHDIRHDLKTLKDA